VKADRERGKRRGWGWRTGRGRRRKTGRESLIHRENASFQHRQLHLKLDSPRSI
jgi:hypothetical protein